MLHLTITAVTGTSFERLFIISYKYETYINYNNGCLPWWLW